MSKFMYSCAEAARLSSQAMDANKDGKASKNEYLEFMGKKFDQAAGAKGYCTFEEIKQAFPESAYI